MTTSKKLCLLSRLYKIKERAITSKCILPWSEINTLYLFSYKDSTKVLRDKRQTTITSKYLWRLSEWDDSVIFSIIFWQRSKNMVGYWNVRRKKNLNFWLNIANFLEKVDNKRFITYLASSTTLIKGKKNVSLNLRLHKQELFL